MNSNYAIFCNTDHENIEERPFKTIDDQSMCYHCQYVKNMLSKTQRKEYKEQLAIWKDQSEYYDALNVDW